MKINNDNYGFKRNSCVDVDNVRKNGKWAQNVWCELIVSNLIRTVTKSFTKSILI